MIDRRVLLAVAAMLLAQSCATPQATQAPAAASNAQIALRNPGFEESPPPREECPPGWGCLAHAGPGSFRYFVDESNPGAGKKSLCIQRIDPVQPWAKVAQGIRYTTPRGVRMRFSGLVRTQAVKGRGAGPIVVVQGGGGEILATQSQPVVGDTAWHPFSVEVDVPVQAFLLDVGVALEGDGLACFDDLRLEVVSGGGRV
jgi:hypothetical protein